MSDIAFPERAIIAARVRRQVRGSTVAWLRDTLHVRAPRPRLASAIGEAERSVRALEVELGVRIDWLVEADTRR